MTLIGLLILAGLLLLAVSLQRTYGSLPLKELKHRARKGDKAAQALHRVSAYGASLRLLLWLVIALIGGWFFVALSNATQTWFAIFVGGLVLWFGFIWLPAQRATSIGVWLATTIAPMLEKVLQYIHPLLDRLIAFTKKHSQISFHTGLYDTEDLLELFDRQKVQSDNRVKSEALVIAENSLRFADKTVHEVLIPRRVIKSVKDTDALGPILMDDLHRSGHSRFPVYAENGDNVVGILYLRSLVKKKATGTVSRLMSSNVCYIHEDQPLTEGLRAIIKTHQQLFIVVNSFEEYVGIITIEDILEAIVGKQIVDEFDEYDDLRAVAARMATKEHKTHTQSDDNIQEITEVVE